VSAGAAAPALCIGAVSLRLLFPRPEDTGLWWRCDLCTLHNRQTDVTCDSCDAPWDINVPPPTAQWRCVMCFGDNEQKHSWCVDCGDRYLP
jgi:hypothetical protein